MEYFLYILFGALGGLIGGMGMGGGTILIPLLTLFLNVPQLQAQTINLISFIPMAIVSLIIHIKNKLVDFLYVDFVEQNLDFFRALESVVSYRLSQLKKEGIKQNINEYDMEDIILTSSINLKSFGSYEIAKITNKKTDAVRQSLLLAQEQVILSAGIGITPLLSMLYEESKKRDNI